MGIDLGRKKNHRIISMEIILHLIFSQQSSRSKRDKIVFMENWWINNDFFKKKNWKPVSDFQYIFIGWSKFGTCIFHITFSLCKCMQLFLFPPTHRCFKDKWDHVYSSMRKDTRCTKNITSTKFFLPLEKCSNTMCIHTVLLKNQIFP